MKYTGILMFLSMLIILAGYASASTVNTTLDGDFYSLTIDRTAPYDSLAAYWSFDTDNTTTSIDLSGNNNGIYGVNSTRAIGFMGGGAFFNNTQRSGIQIGGAGKAGIIANGSNYTISVWVKHTGGGSQGIYGYMSSATGNQWAYSLELDSLKRPYALIGNSTNSVAGSFSSAITQDVWTNLAIVFNKGENKIIGYVNGVNTGNVTITLGGEYPKMGGAVAGWYETISGRYDTRTYTFNGTIDEVMVFNTTLTAAQILAIYTNQSVRFSAPGTYDSASDISVPTTTEIVNITSIQQKNQSTNITIRIHYYDGTWTASDSQLLSSLNSFIIPSGVSFIRLNYTFNSDVNRFYTPYLSSTPTVSTYGQESQNITTMSWGKIGMTKLNNTLRVYDSAGVWMYDVGNLEYEVPSGIYGFFSGTNEDVNRITNNGFEAGALTNWTTEAGAGTAEINSTEKHSGTYSVKLVTTAGNSKSISQIYNLTGLEAGSYMNLSLWYKLEDYSSTTYAGYVCVFFRDNAATVITQRCLIPSKYTGDTAWINYNATVPVPFSHAKRVVDAKLQIYNYVPTTGSVFYDDISLTFYNPKNNTKLNQALTISSNSENVTYTISNSFPEFNVTRAFKFSNITNYTDINVTITGNYNSYISLLKFPLLINDSSVNLIYRDLRSRSTIDQYEYCTDSMTPETLTSKQISLYDNDNIDGYCVYDANSYISTNIYLYDYRKHNNIKREYYSATIYGQIPNTEAQSYPLNSSEIVNYYIKYQRGTLNISKLPIYNRYANMYDSFFSFTDHADYTNSIKTLALMYGTSDITDSSFNTTGGFIPLNLPLTRSVFVNYSDCDGAYGHCLLTNSTYKGQIDLLYNRGSGISLHGTYNYSSTYNPFANSVFSYLDTNYPQTDRTWIAHGYHQSDPSYQGWNISSDYYIVDLFNTYNITSSWSFYDLAFYTEWGYLDNSVLAAKNYSQLWPSLYNYRISEIFEVPKVYKNSGKLQKHYRWNSWSNGASVYGYGTSNASIDNLILNRDMLLPHSYLEYYLSNNFYIYNTTSAKYYLNSTFSSDLQHLSERRNEGKVWVSDVSDLVAYYIPLFDVSYEPTTNGFVLNNNGLSPTLGTQIIWGRNISSVTQDGKSLIYVDTNKFFASPVNQGSSSTIIINEGDSYSATLPKLISVGQTSMVRKAEYDGTTATISLDGRNWNEFILNMTDGTKSYLVTYDGTVCPSTNCIVNTNNKGYLNLTIKLGSPHTLVITETDASTSTPIIGGGGIEQSGDPLGNTNVTLCNETFSFVEKYGADSTKYSEIITEIKLKTGIDYSWTEVDRYMKNWQPYCSEIIGRSLHEKIVCEKSFYFLIANNNYDFNQLNQLRAELASTVTISNSLLKTYLDNYDSKCAVLIDKHLPRKYSNTTIFQNNNIPCKPYLNVSLFGIDFEESIGLPINFYISSDCSHINFFRWIFRLEIVEGAVKVTGIKMWFLVTVIFSVFIIYFIGSNRKINKTFKKLGA